MTNKQYTKEEAEALRKRVLDAAEEANKNNPEAGMKEFCELMLYFRHERKRRTKHYHRKVKAKYYL